MARVFPGELVLVEFDAHDAVHGAVLQRDGRYTYYALDWSKKYQCFLAHQPAFTTGALTVAVGARYWASEGVTVGIDPMARFADRSETVRLADLPASVAGRDAENPKAALFAHAWDLDAPPEYCTVCGDNFPIDQLCDHLVEHEGEVIGAGAYMSDKEERSVRESLIALIDYLGIRDLLIRALRERDFELRMRTPMIGRQSYTLRLCGKPIADNRNTPELLTDLLYDRDEDFAEGFGWLLTLDPGETPEAIERTIGWLELENAALAPAT